MMAGTGGAAGVENSVRIGPDADLAVTLERLRSLEASIDVGNATPILDGAAIDVDPEAVASGRLDAAPGEMFSLSLQTAGAVPRWSSLVLRIGHADLSRAGAVCLIARTAAPRVVTMRPCLRSHPDGGFVDAFFLKRIVAHDRPSTHIDALDLSGAGDVPRAGCRRELLIFFDAPRFELRLLDLRLAIV
jgi:hypothetical protein